MAELLERLASRMTGRRGQRRQRLDQVIDSLSSQSEMDAAQGSDVSGEGGQPQMAEGSAGLMSSMPMMGGGRAGGGQVTTAAGSNSRATTTQAGCPGGDCGTGIGVPRQGFSTGVRTTVAPQAAQATTVQPPPQDASPDDNLRYGMSLLSAAPGMPSASQSGRSIVAGREIVAGAVAQKQIALNEAQAEAAKRGEEFVTRVYEDAEPERNEKTGRGRNTELSMTKQKIAALELSPERYVEQATNYWLRSFTDAGMQPDEASVANYRKRARSEAFGALAAGMVTQAEEIDRLAQQGIPIDPAERSRVIERGLDQLFTAYTNEGLLKPGVSMAELKGSLYNDFFPMFNRMMSEKFLESEREYIAGIQDPKEREAAVATAQQDGFIAARAIYDYVETSFEARLNQQREGTFNSTMGYLQSFFAPNKDRIGLAPYEPDRPVDSNETLPNLPSAAVAPAYP